MQERLSALMSLHQHFFMKWADDYPETLLQFLRENLLLLFLDDAQAAADTAQVFSQLPEVVELDPERAKDLTLLVTGARFAPIAILRGYCLEMLAILQCTVATPYLIDAFEQDEDLGVRCEALRNLFNLKGEKAIPQIRQALKDPEGKMRLKATDLCGFLLPEVHAKIEDLLWNLIEDEEEMARVYARKALGAKNPYSNAPAIFPEPKDDPSRE